MSLEFKKALKIVRTVFVGEDPDALMSLILSIGENEGLASGVRFGHVTQAEEFARTTGAPVLFLDTSVSADTLEAMKPRSIIVDHHPETLRTVEQNAELMKKNRILAFVDRNRCTSKILFDLLFPGKRSVLINAINNVDRGVSDKVSYSDWHMVMGFTQAVQQVRSSRVQNLLAFSKCSLLFENETNDMLDRYLREGRKMDTVTPRVVQKRLLDNSQTLYSIEKNVFIQFVSAEPGEKISLLSVKIMDQRPEIKAVVFWWVEGGKFEKSRIVCHARSRGVCLENIFKKFRQSGGGHDFAATYRCSSGIVNVILGSPGKKRPP